MLKVWFPGTNDTEDYGLGGTQWINDNVVITDNGKLGKCLSFNGSNSRLSTTTFNLSNEWSFCFWAKCNNASNGWMALWALGDNNDSNVTAGYFLIPTQSRSQISFNGTDNSSLSLPSPTAWTHYAGSWDGAKLVYYINGAQVYQKTYTTTYLQKTHLTIGGESNDSTNGGHGSVRIPFNGLLNDFRIYDHCLSPLEVKHLAQGLVLHYPLSMPGQENLYTGSRDFSGTWVNGANWVTDSEQYNGFVVKKKNSIWGGLAQNVPCSNGDIFTISFYAKVDSGGNILSIHRSSLGNVTAGLTILDGNFTSGTDWVTASQTATSWKKYWATVQITSTDITYLQWRIENSVANKFLYVCGMKLERGSRPTPWLPNPADTKYAALGFNDGIEYDVSGFQNNGIRNGTFSWSGDTPRYNTSTYVNSSSSINHPRCLSNDDQEWTCCAWVKLDSSTSYQKLNNFNNGNIVVYGTTPILYLNNGSDDYYMYGSQIIPVDEWTHIAFVFKNSTGLRNIYINGILKNNSGPNKTSTPHGIPDSVTLFGQNFAGYVSDYREYATALSPQDIHDLYAVGASLSDTGVLFSNEVSEV